MEFPGGGGSTARPSGTENPGGWGGQTGKTLRGGGMDIFWNHTLTKNFTFQPHILSEWHLKLGLFKSNKMSTTNIRLYIMCFTFASKSLRH